MISEKDYEQGKKDGSIIDVVLTYEHLKDLIDSIGKNGAIKFKVRFDGNPVGVFNYLDVWDIDSKDLRMELEKRGIPNPKDKKKGLVLGKRVECGGISMNAHFDPMLQIDVELVRYDEEGPLSGNDCHFQIEFMKAETSEPFLKLHITEALELKGIIDKLIYDSHQPEAKPDNYYKSMNEVDEEKVVRSCENCKEHGNCEDEKNYPEGCAGNDWEAK